MFKYGTWSVQKWYIMCSKWLVNCSKMVLNPTLNSGIYHINITVYSVSVHLWTLNVNHLHSNTSFEHHQNVQNTSTLCQKHLIKGPYADHILIPHGSTGSIFFFWFQMKAHIFLIANLKFRLQTPCSFGDMTENVKFSGIPINNFLCIFIIASSPGLHTFFCLWRVNKKLPQGETSQNAFQRSRSISWKWKIHMVKCAYHL